MARSMALADALDPHNLLCYEMWSLEWSMPAAGEHSITSRAIDADGHIHPAQDDPWISEKHTYWESNGQVTRRVAIA